MTAMEDGRDIDDVAVVDDNTSKADEVRVRLDRAVIAPRVELEVSVIVVGEAGGLLYWSLVASVPLPIGVPDRSLLRQAQDQGG